MSRYMASRHALQTCFVTELARVGDRISLIGMENRSHQTVSLEAQVKKFAPQIALGYCLESINQKGEVALHPSNGFWRLEPFEPPYGVPESRMRVLYKAVDGRITPPADPTTPMPTVVVRFDPGPAEAAAEPASDSGAEAAEAPQREPLRADLHPAAESEESMERELFSQHIERNEYSNFKLRSETRARVPPPPPPPPDYVGLGKTLLEILRDLGMKAMDSGYVRRPLPARRNQVLPEIRDAEFSQPDQKAQPTQSAQQAPAEEDDSQEAQQAAEEGGTSQGTEDLRRVLNRMGKVDVSRAFSSPENLRDLLADIRKEIDESREPTAKEKAPAPPSVKTPAVAYEKTSVAAATQAPAPSSYTPPATPAQVPPASTRALVQSSKTPLPSSKIPSQSSKAPPLVSSGKAPPLSSGKTPPLSSGKTPLPVATGRVSPVPSAQTLQPPSVQTPSSLKQVEPSGDSRSPQGQKRW